jgi:hypothetical protein
VKKVIFDEKGKVTGIGIETQSPRTALHPMLFPWFFFQCQISEFYTRPPSPQVRLARLMGGGL